MYNKTWELVVDGHVRNNSGDQHWPLYRVEAPGGWIYKQSISPAGVDTLVYVQAPDPVQIEVQRNKTFQSMYDNAIEDDVRWKYDQGQMAARDARSQTAKETAHDLIERDLERQIRNGR